jgi:hypothetical protein
VKHERHEEIRSESIGGDHFSKPASRTNAPRPRGLMFIPRKLLILNGGQRRDRTADAGLFVAPYQWTYVA